MMERMTITVSASDKEYFEKESTALGMNKSSFVRFLIAEHKQEIPSFLSNRDLVQAFSELSTFVKAAIVGGGFSDKEKLMLYEKMDELKVLMKDKIY